MPLNLRRRFGDVARCGDPKAVESSRSIRFFHPGYGKAPITTDAQPPIRDALVSLPPFDDEGIHYDIAHTVCGILAGNRWDGYFSLDRHGENKVQRPSDGILRQKAYFFCLPQTPGSSTFSTSPYPIVPRFSDWRFPHDNLPPCWEQLRPQFHGEASSSARRCTLTDCGLSIDLAHLVPVKETGWFNDNGMMDYGKATSFSTEAVNSSTNIIPLRTDIHRMFDERNFCFAPKQCEEDSEVLPVRTMHDAGDTTTTNTSSNEDQRPSEGQHDTNKASESEKARSNLPNAKVLDKPVLMAAHVFNSIPGGELQKLFHNREVHPAIYAASLECVFARFAWTIFSPNIFRDFLFMTKEPRLLFVWDEDAGKYEVQRADKSKCVMTAQDARARSKSPTKRQRAVDGSREVEQDDYPWGDEVDKSGPFADWHRDDSSAIDSGFHDEVYDNKFDFPERGRSTKRKFMDSSRQVDGRDDDRIKSKRRNRPAP